MTWLALNGRSEDPPDRWEFSGHKLEPKKDPNWHDAHAARQAERLLAAALRDLAGMTPEGVAHRLTLMRGTEFTEKSSVRRVIRDGRALWRKLDAWPWSLVNGYDRRWADRSEVVEEWLYWSEG